MNSFFRDRGLSLGMIVLIIFAISLAQAGISYSIALGALRSFVPRDSPLPATILFALRFGLVVGMILLWVIKCKRVLFQLIVIANALFTLTLLVHTHALIAVLLGSASEAVKALMVDVALMAASNVLIFSIWYRIIDPPGVEEVPRIGQPWDFLFPQRADSLPHYETWTPRYPDYLFVAFTTSLAFSPADTMPLTRRAKMLMLLQAAISVVTLTGIAGSVINILAGGK